MIKTKAKPQIVVLHYKWDPAKLVFLNYHDSYNKPRAALWTCRWKRNYLETKWIKYLNYQEERKYVVGNSLGNYVYKLTPNNKELKILKLETFKDYNELPKVEDEFWKNMIDYEVVSKEYDAIQFGSKLIKKSLSIIEKGFPDPNRDNADSLYYISIPCTVWFNGDWIGKIELVESQLNETIDFLEGINRSDTMSYLSNRVLDSEGILDYV